MKTFESIRAEWVDARAAERAARERADVAGRAYMDAQCQALIGTVPSEQSGRKSVIYCNIERGHDGPCRNTLHLSKSQ